MSFGKITFDPLFDPRWILVGFILITSVLIWLEIIKGTSRRSLRVALVITFSISLTLILLRPQKNDSNEDVLVLLTENYDPSSVDSLLRSKKVVRLLHLEGVDAFKNSQKVTIPQLQSLHSDIDVIIGSGLDRPLQEMFSDDSFVFIPGKVPDGPVAVNLPKTVTRDVATSIGGAFQSNKDSTQIRLIGPGGVEDSVTLGSGLRFFNLKIHPKATGLHQYRMVYNDREDTIPLYIQEPRRVKILLLHAYPTFESRYLKEGLSKLHQVVARWQISRDRYRTEFINHAPIKLEKLSDEILDKFDVIIVDDDAFSGMNVGEKNSLKESVDRGIGVLMLFNTSPVNDRRLKQWLEIDFNPVRDDTVSLNILSKKIPLQSWPIRAKFSSSIKSIVSDSQGAISGYVSQARGRKGFQFLQETYRLHLKGDSIAYRKLWYELVNQLARKNAQLHLEINADFPLVVNQRLPFDVIGSASEITFDGSAVPMAEDIMIDDLQRGHVWPTRKGWRTLRIDTTSHFVFIHGDGAWPSVKAISNMMGTQRIASKDTLQTNGEVRPFGKVLLFSVCLLALGALWLLPRLRFLNSFFDSSSLFRIGWR